MHTYENSHPGIGRKMPALTIALAIHAAVIVAAFQFMTIVVKRNTPPPDIRYFPIPPTEPVTNTKQPDTKQSTKDTMHNSTVPKPEARPEHHDTDIVIDDTSNATDNRTATSNQNPCETGCSTDDHATASTRSNEAAVSSPVISNFESCKPAYPRAALLSGLTGVTTLHLFIDASGHLSSATVTGSSGSTDLDRAARDGLSRCHFVAARNEQGPIAAVMDVQYAWTLSD